MAGESNWAKHPKFKEGSHANIRRLGTRSQSTFKLWKPPLMTPPEVGRGLQLLLSAHLEGLPDGDAALLAEPVFAQVEVLNGLVHLSAEG